MTTAAPALDRCCRVIELRQYALKPGQRDTLIELFDRDLVEPQEAAGMTVVGQFRDRHRPDRFVWVRGFPDMEERKAALERFYGGPVWAAHRSAANATMIDSSDVLLLKPARARCAFRLDPARPPVAKEAVVVAGIHALDRPADAALVSRFEEHVLRDVVAMGIQADGVFVTESASNTFPALPVREGENVLVWFGTTTEAALRSAGGLERLREIAALDGTPPLLLELLPTSRSRLGGGRPHSGASADADSEPRAFVVLRTRGPAWNGTGALEEQREWKAHADFMDALTADGFVMLGGPVEGTRDALLVFRANSCDEIEQRLAQDPWTKNGLLVTKECHPWQLRLGSLLSS
jgi:uncharacterized protein YciI